MANDTFKFSNLSNWKENITKSHVQPNHKIEGGDFLSSETVVVVSGPAFLDKNATLLNTFVPIGLVQSIQVSQQKQIQQIFEIGSRQPYFIPGRTIISAGMSRILFDGPSLMYAMGINSAAGDSPDIEFAPDIKADGTSEDVPTQPFTGVDNPTFDDGNPNPGYFFINLAAQFFNKPMGLGFILYDGESQPYGGFYLEGCYIASHAFSVSSQQTVLVENVSIRATSLKPLDKMATP